MLKCSHILCKVDNIKQTVSRLIQAGFDVQWGGDPTRAHNAFLWFNQGPFIEFFELPRHFSVLSFPFGLRHGRAAGQRLAWWAKAPQGWCDIALEPEHYQPATALELIPIKQWLQEQLIKGSRIINGRRRGVQGSAVHYRFLIPSPVTLPFIVSHYHPAQRPIQVKHPNGSTAVVRVDLRLPPADCERMQRLLPDDPWLFVQSGVNRHVQSVQLAGWNNPPEIDPFIKSLFIPAQQEEICKE